MLSILMYSDTDFQNQTHQLFIQKGKLTLIYPTLKYLAAQKTTSLQQWLHSHGKHFLTGHLPHQSWFVALQKSCPVDTNSSQKI